MDTLKINVPTFIRLMELSREEIKRDETIHQITELMLNQGDRIIGMEEYVHIIDAIKKRYS